jgi:kumamolisin
MVRVGAAPRVPASAQSLGAVSSSASLSGTVVLKPRDNAALVQFIDGVSNPSSPLFHRYLPARAFAGRFGPTGAMIAAVRSQLAADGLRVTGVSGDGVLVDFSGSTAQIEHAFQTGVERYRLADGSTGQTMTSAAALPSTVAGSVAGIVGLNDSARATPAGIMRAPTSDRGRIRRPATATFSHPSGAPTPCPAATDDAQQFGGLTDDQIARAYGASGLYDHGDLGEGQHVALYELEPFLYSDVRTFDSCYFGARKAAVMLSRLHVIPVDGGLPVGPGFGEANLDVEDLSAMAPGATIDVYEGPSPGANGVVYDPVDEYAAIIDADRDQSRSSGIPCSSKTRKSSSTRYSFIANHAAKPSSRDSGVGSRAPDMPPSLRVAKPDDDRDWPRSGPTRPHCGERRPARSFGSSH